ncbi:hydroxymethylbilane synthase [Luteimicrobium subarcticum]|uniref:Porphobilinogen deaminase n=1 Tax=Luteimicrobium subarcticum TaxID=620910 RepID=A0A2M8WS62_9MICO|nr:hydroxymethylbilane synthase [Luteimicrobium subarcticum]PJI93676.1 hydroxymethylbilane synthase [Luteimicrobium subarcticum]
MTSASSSGPLLRVGTRGSQLALTQTQTVADRLADLTGLPVEIVRIQTDGDVRTGSLTQLGGTGVFVTALRDALLDGRCDVAVHSLKDLPVAPAPGLRLVSPERVDPADVLCTRTGDGLAALPIGARVGTGSPRRAAQLRAARPDLEILDIRGNIDTRLGRVHPETGDLDGVVLARAGLERIGRLDAVAEAFAPDVMLPAPGQGALAVEAREAGDDVAATALDDAITAAFDALADHATTLSVAAERAFLARLEAGCAAPLGALAHVVDRAPVPGRTGGDPPPDVVSGGQPPVRREELVLDAVAVTLDGRTVERRTARVLATADAGLTVDDAVALGTRVADEIAAAMPDVVGTGR